MDSSPISSHDIPEPARACRDGARARRAECNASPYHSAGFICGLKERKINLDDDFIKFVRRAHWRIAKTGQGIVSFITNSVYLDGLTDRRILRLQPEGIGGTDDNAVHKRHAGFVSSAVSTRRLS